MQIYLVKGEKPTNIDPEDIAIYNREVTLPGGSKTIRPTFVLPNGDEYGLVANDQQTDEVQFRKHDGTVINMPYSYM